MTTPIYIIEETKLRRNLQFIADIAAKADIEIILAFKAFALWKTFPIFREYIHATRLRLVLHISPLIQCRNMSVFIIMQRTCHMVCV